MSPLPGPHWTQEEILADAVGRIHPDAQKGIEAFNRGDYFQAHEDLETAWRDETSPVRDVYRGILQIGLAYYHILRGNYRGAVKMLRRQKPWLAPFPDQYRGIDLASLKQDAQRAENELLVVGETHISAFNRSLMKPVRFIDQY